MVQNFSLVNYSEIRQSFRFYCFFEYFDLAYLAYTVLSAYIQDVTEFMDQNLRVGTIQKKKHVLYSNVGSEMKSVGGKTKEIKKSSLFTY